MPIWSSLALLLLVACRLSSHSYNQPAYNSISALQHIHTSTTKHYLRATPRPTYRSYGTCLFVYSIHHQTTLRLCKRRPAGPAQHEALSSPAYNAFLVRLQSLYRNLYGRLYL
ncbi:hypothetical protein F4678DRAFT_79028 [Xylaria arbuscula]|nr:hypothetical protein F4678DRAFT_79028 [Xylaria arbuscula]